MSNFATLVMVIGGLALAVLIVEYKTSDLEARSAAASVPVAVYGQPVQTH